MGFFKGYTSYMYFIEIKIYCQLDDLYKFFEEHIKSKTLPKFNKGRKAVFS